MPFSFSTTPEDCNQTKAQLYACETVLSGGNGLKFFTAENAKDLPQRRLFLSEENIHSTKFAEDGYEDLNLSVEQIEQRGTYAKSYNMRYFPWEVHILEIPLTSLYTNNIVNVVQLPGNIESLNEPGVPNGRYPIIRRWNLITNQLKCVLSVHTTGLWYANNAF